MANEYTDFWFALMDMGEDLEQRARLWNGYLGWRLPESFTGERDSDPAGQQLIVDPPESGWPTLTYEEKATLEGLAEQFGGHPVFKRSYMDFSGHPFVLGVDLSGLILVHANFDRAMFGDEVKLSDTTQFYADAFFQNTTFERAFFSHMAQFHARVWFTGAKFTHDATFMRTRFMGGASFVNVKFGRRVTFVASTFEERCFPSDTAPLWLTGFQKATFMDVASFRSVVFGQTEDVYSREAWPERRVDFTDAVFKGSTHFNSASFGGAPGFFNATLHEDTDFSGIDWSTAENPHVPVEYGTCQGH